MNKGPSVTINSENHWKEQTKTSKQIPQQTKHQTLNTNTIDPNGHRRIDITDKLTATTDAYMPRILTRYYQRKEHSRMMAILEEQERYREDNDDESQSSHLSTNTEYTNEMDITDTEEQYENTTRTTRKTPIMRIRGGAEEEEKNGENDGQDERFALEELNDDEAEPMGGRMDEPKLPGMIRISGCNPNGIRADQVESQLQHSLDLNIDIQCYSEVNTNFLRTDMRQQFFEKTKKMDRTSRSIWGTSLYTTDSEFKPGGTAIISTGKSASRVKKSGTDKLGRWTYQILDGQGNKDVLIISVYQCCKRPTNPNGATSYHQQEVLLSEMDRTDTDPRRNFFHDIKTFIKGIVDKDNVETTPIIIGDWNEECKGTSTSQKLCNEFGLVNVFNRIHPDHKEFKTYLRGSRTIDFVLTTPDIADRVTNFVYEPFLYRLKGDHRGYYFDISEQHLFGNKKDNPYDPEGRSLSSKNRKATATYLKAVNKHLVANNVYERMKKLMASKEPNHEEAERLDREMTQACQHGENKCKKIRLDYWSVEIHTLKRKLSVWCQFKRRIIKKLPSAPLIARANSIGIKLQENNTMIEIDNEIQTTRAAVKKVHKKSAEMRDEWLLEAANIAEDEDKAKKAKLIRQKRKEEKKSRAFRRLKYERERIINGSGITRLQVPKSWPTFEEYDDDQEYNLEDPKTTNPKDNNQWREETCPKEIEFLLRLRNQRHFGQAETDGTPFTTESMKHKFNWNATTQQAELVLKGEYADEEISEITRLLLDNMTRITELDEPAKYITRKDFKGKFKSWRESTSTSPSGRHLGHYKALITTIDPTLGEDVRKTYTDIQTDISDCYITLINYAIKHRYSYERWKTIVNMMIYKEEGNIKIHRLRVIHLYEADLGFLWGIKWGQAMKKAVKEKSLHQGQYGGLPGRDCTSLTYLEELRFDYSTLTRYPLANFDNDATACYDRILCSVSSLAGRKYGIHKDIIFIHAQTLEEAEYKLKTSTKISDTSYKHCIKFPIHGTGQGSTNSPMIWCFISSVLFESHNEKAHGMLFESPAGDMVVRFNMVGFVDDSTCITGGTKNDTVEQLLATMKEDAQLWHDLLWCSGGKLELPKCGYHVIHYDFNDDGTPRMLHSPGESITLQNEHGNDVEIKAKNIFQTRTNLGHDKAPGSTGKIQTEKQIRKGSKLADAIGKCGCTRSESRMLYESVWKPAIEYVIPQSFLSDKQLISIEKASMPQIYAKCGFNRNTARAVLAGPIELGGGGFTPLKVTAGAGYVTHFLKNWRTITEDIGKHTRIVYAWTAYQAGVTFPLFEDTKTEIQYVKGKVIPATRRFLSEIDSKIHLDNTFIRPKLRSNDVSIMDRAITMELTDIQLERINCVRMFLGIMYLSEICTISGRYIRKGIFNNTHKTKVYNVTMLKPKQKAPNNRSWRLWKRVLQTFTINTITNNSRKLITPLAEWTNNHSKSGRWETYQAHDKKIYKYKQSQEGTTEYWEQYAKHGTKLRLEEDIEYTKFSPSDGTPIETETISNGNSHCSTINEIRKEEQQKITYGPMVNWDNFLTSQPPWIRALLEDVEFYTTEDGWPDFYEIAEELRKHGHLICVSDGSVIFHNMSFGWVLATPTGKRLVGSKGPCNGRGNSLRAEGAGMLSATVFFSIMVTELGLDEFKVKCISDNAELIRRCKAHLHYKDSFPNETLRSEYDITEQIYKTQHDHNIKATFHWVKGHQDNNKDKEDLPLEAQLNIEADELAGEYQDEHGKYRPLVNMLPSCPAMLSIHGISVTSNYRKQLIKAYVEPEYIGYLMRRFDWNEEIVQIISWKSLSLAVQRIQRDVLLTKVCNDLLPTAVTLHKMRYQNNDTCVMCNQRETRDHIMLCTSPSRIKWKRKLIGSLRKRLEYLETEFGIGEGMCTAIAEWLETGTVDETNYPPRFTRAITSQNMIGWRHLFGGKLSQEWLKLQEESKRKTKGHKRNSFVWGASIIEVILSNFIELWELRNEEVHGKTEEQQERTRKAKLMVEVRRLNAMRPNARPSDECLFIDKEDEFIEKSSAKTIATYISSHRRAIINSVKKWAKLSYTGVATISQWASRNNSAETMERNNSIRRDRLINDGRKKERRRRRRLAARSTTRQISISGFLSLNNID